jgi:hypothetical protein
MKGRLNLFQAAMLRWRASYPYNAVHVAELPGPFDEARLSRAIDEHLAHLGIGTLALDPKARRFEYAGGPAHVPLRVLAAHGDALAVLEREMERELNEPFGSEPRFTPLRFFAVTNGGSFHLGVAYDHFIAGGDSMVALLKGIAARYDGTFAAPGAPPTLYPPSYVRLFAKNALAFYVGQYLLPGMLLRARRAFRPRYPHGESKYNAFTSFELPQESYAAVVRTAKQWGVTLNDILLAMLLCSLSPEVKDRFTAKRRKEIAIASVINIRHEVAPGTDQAFGQFLSSFLVSHPVPAGITLEALARAVHAQTRRVKRRKLYLQTLYLLACGGLAWRFMTPEQHKQMYAKNYPVWAGMTTLNVESIWNESPGSAPVLHYLRAGSTGPFAPMVMTPASVGDCLHVGVSYRTSAFRREDIDRVTECFTNCARRLAA